MKKAFMCSLCHKGILGGVLHLNDATITYKTNKLTVDRAYRNLVLPLNEICELRWKWIVFPIVTFCMLKGREYTFIIYNKRRFVKWYNKINSNSSNQ